MSGSVFEVGGTHGGHYGHPNSVKFDLSNALAVRRNLGSIANFLPDIQKRALYAMARGLPTKVKKDIVGEYNIGVNRVRKDLKATVLPGISGVRLTGYFRGIGLVQFAARPSTRGVTSQIFRNRPRSLDEGAFIVDLIRGAGNELGNRHVVERYGPKVLMTRGRNIGLRKQKLKTLYGPTVAQMLRKGDRPERVADYAVGMVRDEVDRQLRYFIKDLSALPLDTSLGETDA
jgi:hypothetical protein